MTEKLKKLQLEMIQIRIDLNVELDKLFEQLHALYEDGDEDSMELTFKKLMIAVKSNNKLYNVICDLDDIMEGRV